jgi:hypothetical protein
MEETHPWIRRRCGFERVFGSAWRQNTGNVDAKFLDGGHAGGPGEVPLKKCFIPLGILR